MKPIELDREKRRHHEVLIRLVMDRKVRIFCEIGIWKGSNVKLVLGSPASSMIVEYFAIDQWKEDQAYWPKKSQESWDLTYWRAVKLYPWFHQLKIIRMDSVSASRIFWDGYFDFVYIDGDHRYKPVQDDIKAWLPKVRRGGIIGGHDYFEQDEWNDDSVQVKYAVDDFFGKGNFTREKHSVWIKEIE